MKMTRHPILALSLLLLTLAVASAGSVRGANPVLTVEVGTTPLCGTTEDKCTLCDEWKEPLTAFPTASVVVEREKETSFTVIKDKTLVKGTQSETEYTATTYTCTFTAQTKPTEPSEAPAAFDLRAESSDSTGETTTAEPVTTTAEPATTTAEPVTTTAEPATTTAEPVTTTAEPVTTTAEPVTTTPEPATTTAGPEPATTTAGPEPATTTPGPEPATTTKGPEPATTTPGPEPATTTKGPEPATTTPGPEPEETTTPEPFEGVTTTTISCKPTEKVTGEYDKEKPAPTVCKDDSCGGDFTVQLVIKDSKSSPGLESCPQVKAEEYDYTKDPKTSPTTTTTKNGGVLASTALVALIALIAL